MTTSRDLIARQIEPHLPPDLPSWSREAKAVAMADAILAAFAGRIIPALPVGWELGSIDWSLHADDWVAELTGPDHRYVSGHGDTWQEALAAAVTAVLERGDDDP